MRWKELGHVAWEAWPVGLTIIGLLVAWFWAGLAAAGVEDRIRFTSGILQIFGLLLVAYELSDRPTMFGVKGLFGRVFTWGRRVFALLRHPARHDVSAEHKVHIALDGTYDPPLTEPASSSLADKVDYLLGQVEAIHEKLDRVANHLRTEHRHLATGLAQERKDRQAELAVLRAHMAEAATSSLHLEWVGVVWLLAGLWLGTWTEETARWLSAFNAGSAFL